MKDKKEDKPIMLWNEWHRGLSALHEALSYDKVLINRILMNQVSLLREQEFNEYGDLVDPKESLPGTQGNSSTTTSTPQSNP